MKAARMMGHRGFAMALVFFCATVNAVSQTGTVWLSERRSWIDADSGSEITQWTSHDSASWHLYFNIESFIDERHALIYSNRSGRTNLFTLDIENGELTQRTDEQDLEDSVWHWPHHHTLWYFAGSTLKALDTRSFASRVVYKFPSRPRSFTVTCDGQWIIYSVDQGAGMRERKSLGPYAIYRLPAEGGEPQQISPDYGFVIAHLQASPTDPERVLYCWQHLYREGDYTGIKGGTPMRVWWIRIDGGEGGPVGPQPIGLHRTHEFWFPDGSRIGYSARYQFGPMTGRQFLGSCKPDGSDDVMMEAPVLYSHSQMFRDMTHWVVDLFDGPVLTLLTIGEGRICRVKKLFRHDSSWQGQPSHPHPHFSPDGRYILFSTDRSGRPQVYTVRVDLAPPKNLRNPD